MNLRFHPLFAACIFFLGVAILSTVRAAAPAEVRTGADRILLAPYQELIRGKKIGILAHFASRTREGVHLVDLLHARPDLTDLKMIFAPEHGFRGAADE